MNSTFAARFDRDLKSLPGEVRRPVRRVIEEDDAATDIRQVRHIKSLKGDPGAYRIRIGDYRIGIRVQDRTVRFSRCLHRHDIYRSFP